MASARAYLPHCEMQLYCMFRGHTGTVWFDDVAVTEQVDMLCQCSENENYRYNPTYKRVCAIRHE
eukprot:scaffold7676_cov511-Prasinococcus_capsulatus_cf.AAC.1